MLQVLLSLAVVHAAALDVTALSSFPLLRDSSLPLLHKRVLLCQPRTTAAALASALVAAGARPIWCPMVSVSPLDDHAAIDEALLRLAEYHVLALLTRSAVDAFLQRGLQLSDNDAALFRQMVQGSGVELAAFGGGATRLAELGWPAGIVPLEHSSSGLASALDSLGIVRGKQVLVPLPKLSQGLSASASRQFGLFAEQLRSECGAEPTCVEAYELRPTPPEEIAAELRLLGEGWVDVVCLGSAAEVRGLELLLETAERAAGQLNAAQGGPLLLGLGSDTLAACEDSDLSLGMELRSMDPQQVVSALDRHFGAGKLLW